jgi:hypothetical protein
MVWKIDTTIYAIKNIKKKTNKQTNKQANKNEKKIQRYF